MFYVVCVYIAIGLVAFIFVPEHIPETPRHKETIFGKSNLREQKETDHPCNKNN